MLNNEYLYGEDVEVPDVPQEIIMRRVELLKEHLEVLLDHSVYMRDGQRCNAVIKAIKFWEDINKDDF